ncbi:hypothetical protein B0H13DRAFT_1857669 [Mycena leptocephala]|nr:hypothetical protein B0H13DRAFT_1857669 [Mycena leptocephala]
MTHCLSLQIFELGKSQIDIKSDKSYTSHQTRKVNYSWCLTHYKIDQLCWCLKRGTPPQDGDHSVLQRDITRMGKKKTQKQLTHLSKARAARWNATLKENIVTNNQSPPRTTTRAQQYISTLRERINDQNDTISALTTSNSHLLSENNELHLKLDQSTSLIYSLEEQNATTSQELIVTKDDLRNAQKLISDQNTIIRQKNQRINRLVREKSVISAKLASVKQELLAAILRAEAAEKLSTSESLRIELLMRTISRLDDTVNSHQQKNKDLYKSLRGIILFNNPPC